MMVVDVTFVLHPQPQEGRCGDTVVLGVVVSFPVVPLVVTVGVTPGVTVRLIVLLTAVE